MHQFHTILSLRLIMKSFGWSFSPFPVIQEEQLSVAGQRMVNSLVDFSLPRKRVVKLTDHPPMTIAVDRGC